MKQLLIVTLVVVLLSGSAGADVTIELRYTYIDLGPSYQDSVYLNDRGEVVYTDTLTGNVQLYDYFRDTTTVIPKPSGTAYLVSTGINWAGVIAGWHESTGYYYHEGTWQGGWSGRTNDLNDKYVVWSNTAAPSIGVK